MIPEEVVRKERLEAIKKQGVDPYPAWKGRTHMAQEVLDTFSALEEKKTPVTVAGRIRALRKHGGISFARLQDASGEIQIALHRDTVGTDAYNALHEQADIGDFYAFTGTAFRTRKGEPSVDTTGYTLLTKSLLPLPEKFHGLTDTEKRYRQRYLDFIVNPSSAQQVKVRSLIVRTMRSYLEKEGFMEVETPVLQPIAGGANANPFVTHHNTLHHDFYLRIAPELFLKRLMVGGFEKVYEFARCFRNEGISPQHNPEFTQIEAYWAYATIEDLMDHIEGMLSEVVKALHGEMRFEAEGVLYDFTPPLDRITFHDIVLRESSIDLNLYDDEESLRDALTKAGLNAEGIIGMGELYDFLYKERVRPSITQPTFVTDYPAAMKPLAKRRENDPRYSASAQLVMNGVEVWNAFNELNDPLEQMERFEEQEGLRERGSEDAQRIDDDYVTALKHGMPPTAGYGIGIDRLTMLLTHAPNLKEVILFPTLKPQTEDQDGASAEPDDAV